MRVNRTVGWIFLLVVGILICGPPAHAYLSYTLTSELKRPGCAGDSDGDCLDNGKEWALAWIVAPHYFYDEDESCSGRNNSYHYSRKDFYQVRPEGVGIQNWSPVDGRAKWVTVTYFLLHPHDCQNHFFGIGGHQGDSEHVRYWLYSYNLRTWYLVNGRYWHHGRSHDFSGTYLEARAREIGSLYASIAADEDGHGSWAGRHGSSSHCAGSEDDFCVGRCDCFIGTMRSAFANGHWEWVGTSRNIGGPAPETWNAWVLAVSGNDAYSIFNVGHGTSNREYWTYKSPYYQKFCGWECNSRKSDGSCNTSAHSEKGCTSSLWEKVNTVCFGLPSASCCGSCGGFQGSCWCDHACVFHGDCCADVGPVCGVRPSNVAAMLSTSTVAASPAVISPPPVDSLATASTQDVNALVARHIPGLGKRALAEQLDTLKWMLTAPQGKIAAAFPELISAYHLTDVERETRAHQRIMGLINTLESAGVFVPDLPSNFVAATIAVEEVIAPDVLPLGLRKGYNPHPDDPYAFELFDMR